MGNKRKYFFRLFSKVTIFVLVLFLFSCSNNDVEVIKINADDLIKEFENNYQIASQKYKKKTIEITGEIIYRGFPKDNVPIWDASYIVFGRVDNRGSHIFSGNTMIMCYFDDVVVHDLRDNDIITIQCRFKKYETSSYNETKDIVFRKGKIINNIPMEKN